MRFRLLRHGTINSPTRAGRPATEERVIATLRIIERVIAVTV